MNLVTHKKFKGGRLMLWGKATVVREAKRNPPPSEGIEVPALAHPDRVIEIVAIAALPD